MLNKIALSNNKFLTGKLLAHNSVFKTWSVEHYSKCSFRCAYCCFDSQGNSISTIDPDKLVNFLDEDIQDAIDSGEFIRHQTKVILSCHTDPYVDLDEKLQLTRHVISYLTSISQPFIIGTRGTLIHRDLDLLSNYRDACEVHFSLPVINPDYIKKFEPHVPAIEDRIEAIWATHNSGINVIVRIDPWIPGATDVEEILQCLPDNINVLVSPLVLSEVFGSAHNSAELIKTDAPESRLLNTYIDFAKHGFCRTATRLFSHLSQQAINNTYINERNRIGFRHKVKWYYPPLAGGNINENASRFLKPDELLPSS